MNYSRRNTVDIRGPRSNQVFHGFARIAPGEARSPSRRSARCWRVLDAISAEVNDSNVLGTTSSAVNRVLHLAAIDGTRCNFMGGGAPKRLCVGFDDSV